MFDNFFKSIFDMGIKAECLTSCETKCWHSKMEFGLYILVPTGFETDVHI